MAGCIQIFHADGSTLAGTRSSHRSPFVRLGRAPDNGVVFDPRRDLLVSAHHVELRAGRDRSVIAVDLGATNGTFIDGVPLEGRAVVKPGSRIELGQGGPVLIAWIGTDDEEPPAVSAPDVAPGVTPGPRIRSPAKPPAGKSRIGKHTFLRLLGEHRSRQRKVLLASIGAMVLIGGAVVAYVLTRPPEVVERVVETIHHVERPVIVPAAPPPAPPASVPGRPPPEPRDEPPEARSNWAEVMRVLRDRVYLVMRADKSRGGQFRSMGTAWSLDPERGLLATNAHVAAVFNEDGGTPLIARSAGDPPVDLRIERVQIHPGYKRFREDLDRYRPLDPRKPGFGPHFFPYDVALLVVRKADVTSQAPGLPLATRDVCYGLGGGEDLAYAGFPIEGQVGGGTDTARPASNSNRFALSRATTPFFGRPERPEDGNTLTYSTETAGGSSGSPVVNAAGQVVGLISAGNVSGIIGHARVGVGGFSYGPRSDLVAELVDGSAGANAGRRAARDRADLLRLWKANKPTVKRMVYTGASVFGVPPLKHGVQPASLVKAADFNVPLPGPGTYGFFFAALDDPVRMKIVADAERFESDSWWHAIRLKTRRKSARFRITLIPDSADQSSGRVLVVLFRLD